MPLRKLNIGTYVSKWPPSHEGNPDGNPFYPISIANMDTPVFDVVHMFSERAISAVPIIDEEGIVVNLYETVDVIVSVSLSKHSEAHTDS
jgi:5'-AMP-activated protein kinase, regulatory gamma subunit